MPIGDRIKELRGRKSQSLQQLADSIGASKAHIWELENNRSKNPSLDLLQKLAGHFGTTVAYLIDEPAAELTRAQQFFSRNSERLALMGEKDFDVFEQLLDVITQKQIDR